MFAKAAVTYSDTISKIDQLDLEPIAFKVANPDIGEQGPPPDEVREMVSLYRQFLKLIAMYPNRSIVPSKRIDKVWHTHILDTAKYADDCQKVFGYFLHHFPYFGLRSEQDANDLHQASVATRELFALHFGIDMNGNPAECEPSCSDGSGGGCDYSITDLLKRERPRLSVSA